MENDRDTLQSSLQQYISDCYNDIGIIRDFTNRSDQWEQARQAEVQELDRSELSELEMGAVLEKTLAGLKDLQSFLEAVEHLVASSVHVFLQQNNPEVYGVVLSCHVMAPLLLLFKKDTELFFKAKILNKEVLQKQLNSYIRTARILCEGFKQSPLDYISLNPPQIHLEDVSEEDSQRMLSQIQALLALRADPHFRMLCLFQGKSSTFRQMFSELKPQMEECLGQLEECAQKLDSMNLGAHISGVVSSTLGIIAAILGVIAIPLTGGTSLALTATGVGIGAASGIQGIVTILVEHGVNNTQNDRAKEVYEKCMKLMKQMQQSVHDIIHEHFQGVSNNVLKESLIGMYNGGVLVYSLFGAVDTFKECIKEGEVAADAAYDASEGTLEVSRVVGKGVRLARVGQVVTEGLNVVFAGVDVYFLCSDIKGLLDGTETEVSKWIRARSGLCRAEIQSWQKTQDLIGQDERLSDQELLKKYFWPEQSPALL
ncbi:uncharacterized protein LOC129457306 [Periophthalmus magnuspinnatus]|uniref:uncharacterized protein LOC129457306 n=1 Tax=Periophthalmus magnuspinnatus TaxID=409849 RepID=UPI002436C6D5|nr:uncharacterized protein LOC129457306 [Periophthalmus magnuspinnatus]